MRNKTRLFGLYLPFFILLLLGAITLRTIALINHFNYNFHYFTLKTLPAIANALIVAGIFFFIIYIIGTKKKISLIPCFSSPCNYIPSAALSAALVFVAIHFSLNFYSSAKPLTRFLSLALAALALLSIVYLVLNTVFVRTVSIRRASFGLAIIVLLALYLSYIYFDSRAPINSPVKIVDQLTFAFSAVFFLYEIRLSLGREKWKSYIIFGFIAATLSAYSAIPAIIVYFTFNRIIATSIYESILTLTIFIFIAFKLILIDRLTDAGESSFVIKLKKAAKEREEQLNPKVESAEEKIEAEESEEPDENQISILDTRNNADEEINSIAFQISDEEAILNDTEEHQE